MKAQQELFSTDMVDNCSNPERGVFWGGPVSFHGAAFSVRRRLVRNVALHPPGPPRPGGPGETTRLPVPLFRSDAASDIMPHKMISRRRAWRTLP